MLTKDNIADRFLQLQNSICSALESEDGLGKFTIEKWEREEGGGGVTRILQHGNVIEKGGVNFSAVHGNLPENIQQALKVNESEFFATGVSIVIHPSNPMVPIIHMNVRYFELKSGMFWFGGGIDLTPHYVNEKQAKWFHGQLKNTCDKSDISYYPKFKNWADDYFFIRHRNETRGIGGIFFDRLTSSAEPDKQKLFDFVIGVGETFVPVYTNFMKLNRSLKFTDEQKKWQLIRRGRYVEFNLVYDKGTKFGLDTNGRIESILMSLPEQANWFYNHVPEKGSEEEKTLSFLKKGIIWV
jgi:coproporphyrinogen III oxidase